MIIYKSRQNSCDNMTEILHHIYDFCVILANFAPFEHL